MGMLQFRMSAKLPPEFSFTPSLIVTILLKHLNLIYAL